MASYKLFLDVKNIGESGKVPIKILLSHAHTNTRIDTGVSCYPSEWTERERRPISGNSRYAKEGNDRIEEIIRKYDNAIYELTKSGRIRTMRPADIRAYVDNIEVVYTSSMDFFALAAIIAEEKGTVTSGHIMDAVRWVRAFVGRKGTLPFEDITLRWLNAFTTYMSTHSMQKGKRSLSQTTQGIIMRNIKAIYNRAIADGQVSRDSYPFKNFNMPKSNVRKQFLMPDDIRKIRDAELDPTSRVAASRDYFMLSFYLCGTNLADIWKLSRHSNAYVRYRRTKVENKVDDELCIRMQPEVADILKRHRGKRFLFDAQDHYLSYESFYHSMKHGLNQLADSLNIHLTYYMARYTWATFADHENVPEYVIDRSLGHAPTTIAGKHYISYDWRKTDRANRLVLDYVASDRPWDEEVDW